MEISSRILVGKTISYARKELLSAIEKDHLPAKNNWYALTTAFEKENLFYILSGAEFRHPMYHREKLPDENDRKELRLLGIAGSKKEAISFMQDLIVQLLASASPGDLKSILQKW